MFICLSCGVLFGLMATRLNKHYYYTVTAIQFNSTQQQWTVQPTWHFVAKHYFKKALKSVLHSLFDISMQDTRENGHYTSGHELYNVNVNRGFICA